MKNENLVLELEGVTGSKKTVLLTERNKCNTLTQEAMITHYLSHFLYINNRSYFFNATLLLAFMKITHQKYQIIVHFSHKSLTRSLKI